LPGELQFFTLWSAFPSKLCWASFTCSERLPPGKPKRIASKGPFRVSIPTTLAVVTLAKARHGAKPRVGCEQIRGYNHNNLPQCVRGIERKGKTRECRVKKSLVWVKLGVGEPDTQDLRKDRSLRV